ncbi:FK506 binding protein [Aureococcus anophagefferens]|nr:FK506 binding protein [Aureococcus anophagefferens]
MFARLVVALAAVAPLASSTDEAGKAWLAEKATEAGVISLPSGLMYKVLREGDGDAHPLPGTSCSCHYAGTLIDGTTFDSSYDRGSPTSFAPNQVIAGWTEAMQLMVKGDKWEMYIPSELGYGDRGSPPKIPGGAPLAAKDAPARAKELARLAGMKTGGTKPELAAWLGKRKAILQKMVDGEL